VTGLDLTIVRIFDNVAHIIYELDGKLHCPLNTDFNGLTDCILYVNAVAEVVYFYMKTVYVL